MLGAAANAHRPKDDVIAKENFVPADIGVRKCGVADMGVI